MVSKKKFLGLLVLPCAAALVLAASATRGQSTPQTSPSGGMMSTPMGGMMTSPGAGMSTTPYHGGAMETTPGAPGMGTGGSMMARMEESDRRLDELVSTMNSATGSAKVDAIAAVVNELVAQHRQMHQHMMGGMRGGKHMMGKGTTSTTPGTAMTPRPHRRRTTGTTSPAPSPTPMP